MNRSLPILVAIAVLGTSGVAVAKKWPNKRPPAAERGKEVYETHCVSCHGVRGAGDGPAASALAGPVPDLSSGLAAGKTEDMVRVVLRGRGLMPAYDIPLSKDDASAVVAHFGRLGEVADEAEAEAAEEAEEAGDTDEVREGARPE